MRLKLRVVNTLLLSQVVDLVRDEIGSMLEQVINDGLRKGVMNTSMLHNFLPRRRTVMYLLH